jgi:hypothetical protein
LGVAARNGDGVRAKRTFRLSELNTERSTVSKSLNTAVAFQQHSSLIGDFPDARLVLETFSSGQAVVI